MKKVLQYVFLVVLLVIVLAACSPVAGVAQFVQLPEALQLWITALSVFVVGWLFSQIGAALPWFVKLFGQYQDEIAFALAGAVIGAIQEALNMIPPAWETVGNLFLSLIVAVLAALQVFRLVGKFGVKTFRAK